MLLVALAIRMTSPGPVLHWSRRVGQNNVVFHMPKFRSMKVGTEDVATHLLMDPHARLTPIGGFLRRISVDELPQLWSILKGHMSLVGPRAALHNQDDLVDLRTQKGIHLIVPGLTGWAQVNGRDDVTVQAKVELDDFYLHNRTLLLDLRIVLRTILQVFVGRGVAH
jgi:O-antigen biosynthesis protein WbqP